ncbi:hypothetical protein Q3G72_014018 [Acer saccharum]|nr:hypothetical protein Q3G72_014018 [Acer saccharum]
MKGAEQDDDAVVEEDVGGKAAGDKAAVQEDVDGKAAIEEDVEEVGELQDVAFVRTAGEQDSLGEGVKLGKGGEGDEAVVQGVKHIQSFFDILWRRRSSSELSYMQNIGLVNTSFFTSINIKWQTEMKSLDSLKEKAKSLKDDRERSNPKETTSPQQKKDRKKRVKKSSDASPKAVNVWEDRCDPACVSVSVGGDGSRAHRSDWGQTGDIWIDQLQCPPNNLVTPHVSWGAGMKLSPAIDRKPFIAAMKRKFTGDEADIKALKL